MKTNRTISCWSLFVFLICFGGLANFSIAQTQWYKYPGNPVFPPGKSGEWDEAKIAHTVLFDEGQYHMWYKGWSDDVPGWKVVGIGYAFSPDGIHWQKHEANPLEFKCEGISWDTAFKSFEIIKIDSLYLLWFTGPDKKFSTMNVGFAWSENGLDWTKHPEPVMRPGKDDEWDGWGIQTATVYFDGMRYHMWYCGHNQGDQVVQGIGYAQSDDGIHWEKHPSNPVLDVEEPGAWDNQWMGVYGVTFNGYEYEMWFNGYDNTTSQVGYARSVDGINWIKSSDNPVLLVGELGHWDTWFAKKPTVVYHDSIYRMWYYGHDYSRGNIGYATTSVDEFNAWDTATTNKPQRIFKVQLFNRQEYINVDSLTSILPEVSGTEMIDACNKLALAYSLNDSKKSLEYAEKALKLSDKENYPEGRAMALYSIGNSQYIQDNYSDALASQLSALWLFDSLNMQFELGNLLCQIAGIHANAGSNDLSCRYYKQAVDVFETLNDTTDIIYSMMYLGYSYLVYGDTASAFNTFQRSLAPAKAYRNMQIQSACFEAIGICYSGHNLDSALHYFNMANKIWNHAGSEAYNFLITAEAYFAAGSEYYDDAEEYFVKCFPLLIAGRGQKVWLHLDVAELYFVIGRYDECKERLDVALEECQNLLDRLDYKMYASLNDKLGADIVLKKYMEKIYRLYYRLDTALHDKELAFTHFRLATQWKDSLYDEQNRKKTAMAQRVYEIESAQNRVGMLQKENEIKDLRLQQSMIVLIGLAALVLIIIVGATIFIRNRRFRAQHALEVERVKAEKLKELDQLKSRFFANISHEFRTPLTLIMGPLDKLLSKAPDNPELKDLKIAKKYANRLQSLINQLLAISKIEAGKMSLHAIEIDIVKQLRIYLQAFESLATQRDITLKFTSENKEIKVFIDKEKLEQIINNLLSNALKFTGEGGRVEVEVSSQQSAVGSPQSTVGSRQSTVGGKPSAVGSQQSVSGSNSTEDWRLKTADFSGPCVSLSISDTGRGIPPNQLTHIFDRFYQAEAEDSFYEGTGIGLALVKELVELNGGEIEVESVLDQGSTFRIYFPLGHSHLNPEQIVIEPKQDDDLAHHSQESLKTHIPYTPSSPTSEEVEALSDAEEPEENNASQPILLIVEDNADMRSYIREYFENEYLIIEAGDGADGYEKSIKHIPDIIISDVMMPNMDGNEFCAKVKTDERTSHIPVVLLTARASKESRIEGLETGADDFITKPFDRDELQVRVKNLIQQRQRTRKLLEGKIQKSHSLIQVDFDDSGITSMDAQFLSKVIEIVKQEHSDPEFNTKAFGMAIGLGRIQLNRKIKALTGQTTVSFIRTFRLNRAAGLIKKKSATVAEIAYDVGFSSPSYFSECFQKQFGKLPSDYQNY